MRNYKALASLTPEKIYKENMYLMKKRKNRILAILTIIILCMFIFINIRGFKEFQKDILFLKFLNGSLNYEDTSEENLDYLNAKNIDLNIKNSSENIEIVTNESRENQYVFEIEYKNMNFQNIDLIDTLKSETLVNEKIAPGIKGNFDIIIYSNHNAHYYVNFTSKNNKPHNLKFNIIGTNIEANSLEELSTYLKGDIEKEGKRIIKIGWEWQYENGDIGNLQDTNDAKTITEYSFDINAKGEEIL